jgi:hypothetical protein
MPSNINLFANKKASKKESDKRKYKKSNDSDGEGGTDNDDGKSCNSHSDTDSSVNANANTHKKSSKNNPSKNKTNYNDNENDNDDKQKFDIQDYRKMLADMFPSKYMSKRVESIENSRERAVESICKDLNIETTNTSMREKEKNESKPSKNSDNKKGKGAVSMEKNTKNKTGDKTGDKQATKVKTKNTILEVSPRNMNRRQCLPLMVKIQNQIIKHGAQMNQDLDLYHPHLQAPIVPMIVATNNTNQASMNLQKIN